MSTRAPQETQSCKFVVTINNVPEDHEIYQDLLEDHVCCEGYDDRFFSYFCLAPERAPTTGMSHAQCYCVTRKPCRTTQVVKKLNEMGFVAHQHPFVEKAVKSHEVNYNYVLGMCEKKGMLANPKFKEIGIRPSFLSTGERQKADYQVTRDQAMKGDFMNINPQHFICHFRSLVAISERYATPQADLEDVCGIWVWGAPGTGKSHFARNSKELFGEAVSKFYVKNMNKWWCGYRTEDHERVIIDDFELSAGGSLGHFVKIWGDRYAFQAEIKGGSMQIRPSSVTITSNYHPVEVFRDALSSAGSHGGDESLAPAILRRYRVFKCEMDELGNRSFTYEPHTGTTQYALPLSLGTHRSFNLLQDLTPLAIRDGEGGTPLVTPGTVVTQESTVPTGTRNLLSPQTPVPSQLHGAGFRTPEYPRNLALMDYMRNANVPGQVSTQPLSDDEEDPSSDEEDEEDQVIRADLAQALAEMPDKNSPEVPNKDREVVDLTVDSDEEKNRSPTPRPPRLERSVTIYGGLRPIPLKFENKRQKKND